MEIPRSEHPLRAWLDVAGGIALATFIGIMCMRAGSAIFTGVGWIPVIAWESVWLVAAMLCSPLMPSGIQHDISWRSTFEGLALDWPELLYATWILGIYVAWIGELIIAPGPLGLSLAVGAAEEFIFRVLLLGWLITKLPAPHALVVSSAVFGLAHLKELSPVGLASVIPQTAGGFILGAIYLRTRNPIAPILAHAYWDYPYFMTYASGMTGSPSIGGFASPLIAMLPWLVFCVYGLWLVRDGISLVGRVDAVGSAPAHR